MNITGCGHSALSDELRGASGEYFKVKGPRQPTIDDIAAYYRERKMAANTSPRWTMREICVGAYRIRAGGR
ncbi:hypothetical protein [Rhodococcus artemisiae]|uniref:Lsr2 protein n=1 Tax=Rhodococcus artemisiae TaxID=714159 RepID=A0ABU7LB43_9NOCA|nr:hypothetical protein [Rhodococcus artemisiae]MEE2058522.1 hypothetical protein [Rhodococcus artemisiae]